MSRAGPGGDSLLGRVIDLFLVGSLPGLLIALSLVGGAIGLLLTPREEEPQIVVPMADVWIEAPGLPVTRRRPRFPPDPRVSAAMFGRIELPAGERERVRVPGDAAE